MLETKRLILRPATLDDAPHLLSLNSDPEVMHFTGDEKLLNLLEAENLIRDRMMAQYEKYKMSRFSLCLKDGTFIGWCGLKYFEDNGEVDLGYRLMKKYWGQGYATEASFAALQNGFEKLNLQKIVARAMPDNKASIKVLQKLGMTFRGLINDPSFPHAFVVYDITKSEFEKCKE